MKLATIRTELGNRAVRVDGDADAGELVATGTPDGVGECHKACAREPSRFLGVVLTSGLGCADDHCDQIPTNKRASRVPTFTASQRAQLTIRDGVIDIGVNRTRFISEDDDGLLRSYLLLLRRARDQRRAASITLRRDDIEVLATYLETTSEQVLGRLADLMGSTRTQRAAMLTVFATGAMLIAATGSVAAGSTSSAVSEFVNRPAPAVIEVAAPTESHSSGSATSAAIVDQAGRRLDVGGDNVGAEVIVEVNLEIHDAAMKAPVTAPMSAPVSAIVERQATPTESLPNETGTTDDGSTVAVGLPPISRPVEGLPADVAVTAPVSAIVERQATPTESLPNETGTIDDGSTVAVGLPPVPVPPSSG